MRALEYGCGTGLLGLALHPDLGRITLADSSPGMLAVLDEKIAASGLQNLRSAKLDLVTEPLPSERFDILFTLMTLHHIADTHAILRSFHTLLDAGGVLCIADLDAEDGTFHGSGFDGHNGFDRQDLHEKALQAGFRSAEFSTVFRITKDSGAGARDYPVFLMVAKK
jgi:ubiquinone/menaquinone biosynthesis C-methylase UbiE